MPATAVQTLMPPAAKRVTPPINLPLLAIVLAGYSAARFLEVVATPVPRMQVVALDVLSALTFALTDGVRPYRLRGILTFAAICVVVGNLTENLGIATGFPFGHYYFVELMGPKIFQIPILLGLAYVGMAYVSWSVAQAILGGYPPPKSGLQFFQLPLLASLVMTAWDLAQDPVWATVLHGWVWRDGGVWFGVPVSNYLGWAGTMLVIYLLFALYLRRVPSLATAGEQQNWPALLFYAICAVGNVCQTLPAAVPAVVRDPTGKPWRVAEITAASALVSIFVMGGFVALAGIRTVRRREKATD